MAIKVQDPHASAVLMVEFRLGKEAMEWLVQAGKVLLEAGVDRKHLFALALAACARPDLYKMTMES